MQLSSHVHDLLDVEEALLYGVGITCCVEDDDDDGDWTSTLQDLLTADDHEAPFMADAAARRVITKS